jgi:RNA recognition motif-containing protein
MYNYQTVIPKPEVKPGFEPSIQEDLKGMIFLHQIPPFIDDDDILELLASCGSVKSWNRVLHADQTPTHYGFCVFEKPLSVIMAMRSIPEGRCSELNTMKITIDPATRNHLKKHYANELKNETADFEVTSKLKYIFEPFVNLSKEELEEETRPEQQLVLNSELQFDEEDETDEQRLQRRQKRDQERLFAFQEVFCLLIVAETTIRTN